MKKTKSTYKMMLFKGFATLFLVLGAVTLYTIFDNNHVRIVRQDVTIKNLPVEFDGFTILQLSDLHGKQFGSDQQNLVQIINSLDYDVLSISGDMSEEDNQPFLDLIDGIQNKDFAYYATGNWGPYAMNEFTGELTEDGQLLELKGVHVLNQVYRIQRGEHTMYISEFWLIEWLESLHVEFGRQQLNSKKLTPIEIDQYQKQVAHGLNQIAELSLIQPEDILIGITHYPFSIDSVSEMPAIVPQYDLVLAGHYHGGQIRLPLIGALYIPDAASEERGFFPEQAKVSGLYDWGDFQQYVSRGLGSSSMIPLLKFRLFNPPEVNLIRLVGE